MEWQESKEHTSQSWINVYIGCADFTPIFPILSCSKGKVNLALFRKLPGISES